MKNITLLLVCALSFSALAFADNDKPVKVEDLPMTAQEFLRTYFPKENVRSVMLDENDGDYEVKLENGVKIEFNKIGSWMEIEGHVALPKGIVSSNIYDYVAHNYKKAKIYKIERDKNGFEIELDTDVELQFDLNGNFVKEDK